MANPFGQDAHGLAGGGVFLGLAPGAGFGEAQAMQNGDHEVDAGNGADQDDAHGFALGQVGGVLARWQGVNFGVGDEL